MMIDSEARQLEEGSRIAVQWKGDNQYYEAIVKKIDSQFLYVEYEINEFVEWIDTQKDSFRILEATDSWTQVSMQDLIHQATFVERREACIV